ncbi:MAG: FAD-dependent oxidoreductase [Endomicrobiia bacterium]
MKIVIIGYSVAAVNAIKTFRSYDKLSKIIVITDEKQLYSRPLISYYLAGKLTKDKINFVEPEFEKNFNIEVRYSTSIIEIDPKNNVVTTSNNEKISFDKLLISTGGKPILPKIEGYEKNLKGVFTFTKFSDAENIISYLEKNKVSEAVILGGGLIGMKAAEGLLGKKIKLKIIDLTDRLLSNTFDKTASTYLEQKLKEFGSEFIKETTIKQINSKDGAIESVVLKNNEIIETKLLIIAVGVQPNIDIAQNSNIKTDKGILVNEFMQTNFENIFAAGDVAQSLDFLSNTNSVIAIWPVAAIQGKVAGYNMTGLTPMIKYDGMFPMNSVEILGIPSISFGITNPDIKNNNYKILVREEKNLYKKIVLRNGLVVGVILVNSIDRAGIYKLIIKEKLNVSEFENELLKDDFGFLVLPKDFRKHFVTGEGIEV